MAAEMNSRSNKQGTIAFTLPISCQICLGKVKQPVLCPNFHVFCSPCMDIWLERNQQCPACRVKISKDNPCKNILGGFNQCEEDRERISNPELRKARFELLYKEYESEIDKYHAKVECLRVENDSLKQKLHKKNVGRSEGYHAHRDDTKPQQTIDMDSLMLLTKKLKEATKLYELLKEGTAAINEEKNTMKEENDNLVRENKHLRLELVNRSPHRFGRYTVATLESKVESHEKEVAQLNKALERSDKYIEEMEAELEHFKNKNKLGTEQPSAFQHSDFKSFRTSLNEENQPVMSANIKHPSKRQLFNSEPETVSIPQSAKPENVNTIVKSVDVKLQNGEGFNKARSQKQLKRVHFNISSGSGESTFDLEVPSPRPVAPSGGSDKNVKTKVQFQDPSESSGVSTDNSVMESSENTLELPTKVSKNPMKKNSQNTSKKRPESVESGIVCRQESSRTNVQSVVPCNVEAELDDTQVIESELDELNISLTPDFTDCMKLLNRAEKKVHRRSSSSEEGVTFTQSAPGRSIPNSHSETERADNGDANMQSLEHEDEMQKHLGSSLPMSSIAQLQRPMEHVLSARLHPGSGIPSSSSHFANTGYPTNHFPVPNSIPDRNVGSCDNTAAAKGPFVSNAFQFQQPIATTGALHVASNTSESYGTVVQRPALFDHSRLPYRMQPSFTSSTLSFLNMVNNKTNHMPNINMKPATYLSTDQIYPTNGEGVNSGLISNGNHPDKYSYENFMQLHPVTELPEANNTNHYYPNISNISNDMSSKSDLSFPEPKKRLFDSDSTDLELPSSPMKSSKMN